ncbi:MAG: tetratricopeptide repeat protein [Magnetococcales bacterium]|nr:tetratricopeptide repeat protein [Magnetococcales bacterium]
MIDKIPGCRVALWGGLLLTLLLAGCAGSNTEEARTFQMLSDKGRAYLERGNATMALPALQQANRLRPGQVALLTDLGLAYDQVGRPVQALESLEEAHRLQPNDGNLNNNLGVARLRVHAISCLESVDPGCQQWLEQAEEAFRAALRDPALKGLENVWFNLALLYKQRGQGRQMEAALEKTLEISGHHLAARLALAEYHHGIGRFELERQQLRAALAINPDHVAVLERLLDSFFATGPTGRDLLSSDLSAGERLEVRALLSRMLSLAPGTEAAERASRRVLLLDNK